MNCLIQEISSLNNKQILLYGIGFFILFRILNSFSDETELRKGMLVRRKINIKSELSSIFGGISVILCVIFITIAGVSFVFETKHQVSKANSEMNNMVSSVIIDSFGNKDNLQVARNCLNDFSSEIDRQEKEWLSYSVDL